MVEVASGHVRDLTGKLDRAVVSPHFTSDGRAIQFAVEDDGFQYPAQVALASGAITHLGESMVVYGARDCRGAHRGAGHETISPRSRSMRSRRGSCGRSVRTIGAVPR